MRDELLRFLREQLPTIEEISARARHAIERTIATYQEGLSTQILKTYVDLIKASEQSAWMFQGGWKSMARAWMLVQLWAGGYFQYGDPLKPQDGTGWLNKVKQLTEDQLADEIAEPFSGKALMQRFGSLQHNHERAHWMPTGKGAAFTDPNAHDPGAFRYLVTALRPDAVGLPIQDGQEQRRAFYTEDPSYRSFTETTKDGGIKIFAARRFLKNPETLTTQVLACSILDPGHTKTYQDAVFGFILHVPTELIVTASHTDLNSNSWIYKAMGADLVGHLPIDRGLQVDEFLENMVGKYQKPLPTPGEVLNQTPSKQHNEVNVLGSNGGGIRVKPCGIFVKVTPGFKLFRVFENICQTELGVLIRKCYVDGKLLPIVPIPDSSWAGEVSDVNFETWLQGGPLASPPQQQAQQAVAPVLRPGDRVRFLQRVSPDRYCIATVLEANSPPMFNGMNQWPDRKPDTQAPNQPATFRTTLWNQPIVRVYVRAVSYEPSSPADVGLIYSPAITDVTKI